MFGCDTFVVLPPLTKPGGVIFGKNSDRPRDEAQEIVFYSGRCGIEPGTKLKCTYIEIEECDKTYSVILSKPTWMWGAEMGSNSAGVSIGNEAVWTNGPEESSEKKLLGMDLVRLGLERGGSAEDALNIITQLLEKYGQGGPCSRSDRPLLYHNSFLIADCTEAWVLETTGPYWIAEKVKGGYRNLSNTLSISTNFDKISPNLKKYAIDSTLWDGKGEFNFKQIFSSHDCPREVSGRKLLESFTAGGSFCVQDMFSVLRDKESGICMDRGGSSVTAGSQVSLLMESTCVHWFTGTVDPSLSVFKPFLFTTNVNISQHTVSKEGDDPLLYKLHEATVLKNPAVIEELKKMEETCTLEMLKYCSDPSSLSSSELDDLFKDVVETEVKFYK